MKATTVGIIGDFNPANSTHLFTNNAIQHAAQILDKSIETVWLPTDKPVQYNDFQGLFGSPGSPYRSFAGALSGICYAREHNIPFIGTCGGFQHLLIEYARNVMGMKDAAHPFFLGTLFVPQANSTAGNPHPLILEFCRSAVSCGRERFEYAKSDAKGSGAPTRFFE
jgi:CTP synthase (UTP-ammonia lyase)